MEEKIYQYTKSTIYPSMWKPTLVKGIPRDYAIIALMVIGVITTIGIVTTLIHPLMILPFGILAYVFGLIMAHYVDPEFMTILLVKFVKIRMTKGSFKGNKYFF